MYQLGFNPKYQAVIDRPHRVVISAEYSNDRGLTWTPLEVESGSVTADRGSQTRWSVNGLSVSARSAPVELGGTTPFGTRVRLRWGVKASRQTPLFVPMGIYRVDKTAKDDGTATVQLDCASLEEQVSDARFLVPTTFGGGAGDTAKSVLETLLREAVPDASFDWRVDGSTLIPKIHQDTDRWAFLAGDSDAPSIANALGAELYTDQLGTWVIAPTPTLADLPVWEVAYGGAKVGSADELSREGVYNVVVANGESTDTDAAPVGPGIAWDNDPDSPTYAGPDPVNRPELAGPFGLVPRFYTSPLLTSVQACRVAARSIIADALGLHKSLTFTSKSNPALEPGDVVRVEVERGVFENHLVDAITWDLGAATMSCSTRSTSTRLLGDGDVQLIGDTGDVSVSAPEDEVAA